MQTPQVVHSRVDLMVAGALAFGVVDLGIVRVARRAYQSLEPLHLDRYEKFEMWGAQQGLWSYEEARILQSIASLSEYSCPFCPWDGIGRELAVGIHTLACPCCKKTGLIVERWARPKAVERYMYRMNWNAKGLQWDTIPDPDGVTVNTKMSKHGLDIPKSETEEALAVPVPTSTVEPTDSYDPDATQTSIYMMSPLSSLPDPEGSKSNTAIYTPPDSPGGASPFHTTILKRSEVLPIQWRVSPNDFAADETMDANESFDGLD